MVWARTKVEGATDGTVDDGVFADVLANFKAELGSDLVGATVIRMRGDVMLWTAATTATDQTSAVLGARVFTESNLPIVNEQGPATDRYADWMLWQPFALSGVVPEARIRRHVIDVKSMRRIDEIGQGLLFGWQTEGAFAISGTGYLSTLLKLP